MFTQFKFSPSQISQAALLAAHTLATARPGANPAAFACQTVAARLRADPGAYLHFGPYWWAVKAALFALGEDFGPTDDGGIRLEYGARLPVYGALVAGEQFRDFYLRTYLAGTCQFWLDGGQEESYVLFDADMEARRIMPRGARAVAADLMTTVEGEEPILDGVLQPEHGRAGMTPFEMEFVADDGKWQAELYGTDQDHAASRLEELRERIVDAIAAARERGEAAFDDADYDSPLFVDLGRRAVVELENAARPAVAV